LINLKTYDPEDLPSDGLVIFIVPTYTDGTPNEETLGFYNWLEDVSNDFRISKVFLQNVKYAIFGLGDKNYGENFATVAKKFDVFLHKLSATRILALGEGDAQYSEEQFDVWMTKLWPSLLAHLGKKELLASYKRNRYLQAKNIVEKDEEKEKEKDIEEEAEESDDDEDTHGEPLVDVEDLGKMLNKEKEPEEDPNTPLKEMITPSLRKALTKEGYKLIGTHSGVKLCRWTKAMLRGRGGCYKHTFYGIESYRCMEMTPSLACANKCVFCWRHHKNPVGKEWKWKMDDPDFLIEGAISNHQTMIKTMKGVPGVIPERYNEAFKIRHCALSLVGEPIIYPEINQFINNLHSRGISSFLVTNAQFPDRIEQLKPVTQLYISVDAATPESLKKRLIALYLQIFGSVFLLVLINYLRKDNELYFVLL